MMEKAMVSLYCEVWVIAAITRIAQEEERSQSNVIARLVKEALKARGVAEPVEEA